MPIPINQSIYWKLRAFSINDIAELATGVCDPALLDLVEIVVFWR
jgi:hypothetical protein